MELRQDQLKEGKSYIVMVAHKFEGKFTHFESESDGMYAMFELSGKTDRGNQATRKVRVTNIIELEQTKIDV